MCYVLGGIDFTSISTIYRLDFGTDLTVWYPNKNIFFFFILIDYVSRNVLLFLIKRPQASKSWGHIYG